MDQIQYRQEVQKLRAELFAIDEHVKKLEAHLKDLPSLKPSMNGHTEQSHQENYDLLERKFFAKLANAKSQQQELRELVLDMASKSKDGETVKQMVEELKRAKEQSEQAAEKAREQKEQAAKKASEEKEQAASKAREEKDAAVKKVSEKHVPCHPLYCAGPKRECLICKERVLRKLERDAALAKGHPEGWVWWDGGDGYIVEPMEPQDDKSIDVPPELSHLVVGILPQRSSLKPQEVEHIKRAFFPAISSVRSYHAALQFAAMDDLLLFALADTERFDGLLLALSAADPDLYKSLEKEIPFFSRGRRWAVMVNVSKVVAVRGRTRGRGPKPGTAKLVDAIKEEKRLAIVAAKNAKNAADANPDPQGQFWSFPTAILAERRKLGIDGLMTVICEDKRQTKNKIHNLVGVTRVKEMELAGDWEGYSAVKDIPNKHHKEVWSLLRKFSLHSNPTHVRVVGLEFRCGLVWVVWSGPKYDYEDWIKLVESNTDTKESLVAELALAREAVKNDQPVFLVTKYNTRITASTRKVLSGNAR
ncbi:hypothetical protein BJ508DRAFT_381237 [Ascobolus immersus RN42]|uniref:Uncharacterized protein n=1 Tax=Ascobolus immersus RN42 TaxID=1160509 RepID=A0A3N4HG60_ASCIM|nr:hypothetical protein BJ508DRAFT_381237 [Ascobolus immersus RN42]